MEKRYVKRVINMELLKKFWELIIGSDEDYHEEQTKDLSLEELVEQAKWEWRAAESFFEQAVDEDLVDYAIYELEAAERKYMYLLKQAAADKN